MIDAVLSADAAGQEPFVVSSTTPPEGRPWILNDKKATGVDFPGATYKPRGYDPVNKFGDALVYLQEGIRRMTGVTLEFDDIKPHDVRPAIVFTIMNPDPLDTATHTLIRQALTGEQPAEHYTNHEAFAISIEPRRITLIANSLDGLACAVPDLLETVGYEVLGMGPNWTYVPRLPNNTLAFPPPAEAGVTPPFAFQPATLGQPGFYLRAGRPSFYYRELAMSYSQGGAGTIFADDPHPLASELAESDEPMQVSHARWLIGTRTRWPFSLPQTPGHAFSSYHDRVVMRMMADGQPEGFLNRIPQGPTRPPDDSPELGEGDLWIRGLTPDDPAQMPHEYYIYRKGHWVRIGEATGEDGLYLDVSVERVRDVIWRDMLDSAAQHFDAQNPECKSPFYFEVECEDGGPDDILLKNTKNPGWYKLPAQTTNYPLDGLTLHGLTVHQPDDVWRLNPTNTLFGLSNWLLAAFDASAAPEACKPLVRCLMQSYGYHDVPPTFHLDQRIQVTIGGYSTHRGISDDSGDWRMYLSREDVARAFNVLLPEQPLSSYKTWSSDTHLQPLDPLPDITSEISSAPGYVDKELRVAAQAGIEGMTFETDFNFGRYGLQYYFYTKLLWNLALTDTDLTLLGQRWLQRAFGSVWQAMGEYYDLLKPENYPVNSRTTWGLAARLLENAQQLLAEHTAVGPAEPEVQLRLDDVKQYWYYAALFDRGLVTQKALAEEHPDAFREFIWKGQMSYMTTMVAAIDVFPTTNPALAAPKSVSGVDSTDLIKQAPLQYFPAHYPPADATAADSWWGSVLAHWKPEPGLVEYRADIDQNNLVAVPDFNPGGTSIPTAVIESSAANFIHDFNRPRLLKVARENETIGFKVYWPAWPIANYAPFSVSFGLSRWIPGIKPGEGKWDVLLDMRTNMQEPVLRMGKYGGVVTPLYLVEYSYTATEPGRYTYKFDIGPGAHGAVFTGMNYSIANEEATAPELHTYRGIGIQDGTNSPGFFYIPMGTEAIWLDVYGYEPDMSLSLHPIDDLTSELRQRPIRLAPDTLHGVPCADLTTTKGIIGELNNWRSFPYLYSVPRLWALSVSELLVPLAIAQSDFHWPS